MSKLPEGYKPYTEEKAYKEASKMQQEIESGEAEDYNEAEKIIEASLDTSIESCLPFGFKAGDRIINNVGSRAKVLGYKDKRLWILFEGQDKPQSIHRGIIKEVDWKLVEEYVEKRAETARDAMKDLEKMSVILVEDIFSRGLAKDAHHLVKEWEYAFQLKCNNLYANGSDKEYALNGIDNLLKELRPLLEDIIQKINTLESKTPKS